MAENWKYSSRDVTVLSRFTQGIDLYTSAKFRAFNG